MKFSIGGPFYIFRLSQRGGPGPPRPPSESATGYFYGAQPRAVDNALTLFNNVVHYPLLWPNLSMSSKTSIYFTKKSNQM